MHHVLLNLYECHGNVLASDRWGPGLGSATFQLLRCPAGYVISLCLSLVICKMGIIVKPKTCLQDYFGNCVSLHISMLRTVFVVTPIVLHLCFSTWILESVHGVMHLVPSF